MLNKKQKSCKGKKSRRKLKYYYSNHKTVNKDIEILDNINQFWKSKIEGFEAED